MEPKEIRKLGVYGLIRQNSVDDKLLPDDTITNVSNCHFDRIGAVSLRGGVAGLGSTVSARAICYGMHNTQNGSMFAVFSEGGSARIYTYGGAAWASNLTDGTANTKIRFVNFADRTVVLNFGTATNMYSSMAFTNAIANGGWATTGDPINPQEMTYSQPQYGEVYKSRMYVAGGNTNGTNLTGSRLYFSNVIGSDGNVAWDPATNSVDINPNDGENISALKRFSLELLIFKPNYIYRFKTEGVDPDPLIKIGTRSQESVAEGKLGLYFHHDSGFFRYAGGYPKEISKPISDIAETIPFSYFDDISSLKDEDHIYWSVGDLTVKGESWKNVVLRYTESSDLWTVYRTANEIRYASDYNSGTTLTRIIGTDNGLVGTFNSGTTDFGEPIGYYFMTKWYEWGEVENRKLVPDFIAICEKAQGSGLMCQVDDEASDWKSIGEIKRFLSFFQGKNIRFHRIRFKLNGVSTEKGFVFLGLKIPKGQIEGIIRTE